MNKDSQQSTIADSRQLDPFGFGYQSWRERFVVTVLRVASLFGLGLLIVTFSTGNVREKIITVILFVIFVAITFLRSPYWLRAGTLLALSYFIGLNALLTWGVWREGELFFLFSIVMAGLLFDKWIDIAAFSASTITILVVAFLNLAGKLSLTSSGAPTIGSAGWMNFAAEFVILGVIMVSAMNLFKREFSHVAKQMRNTIDTLLLERSQLEQSVQVRSQELELKTNHLRSSTSIARTVSQIQDITELLNAMVHLTAERFGYYHVGIYLLDVNKKVAFLQAASSEEGKTLIANGHRVDVDKRNAINIILSQRKPYYIGNNLGTSSLKDEAYPHTRSRLILALQVRGSMMGVLDLHSDTDQAFGQEDAENFQSLADLVAVSTDNVRLLNETKTLVGQLESFSAYQSKQSWQAYPGQRTSAYQYTPAGIRPIFPSTQESNETADALKIPLLLRGQSIGSITLRRKEGSAGWTERERILIEKIAEQAALALENSRLVEEAQRNAQRDQLIANISSRVRETLDVDSVIRTAAVELRRIFDLKEAEVSVGTLISENTTSQLSSRKLSNRGTKPLQ